MNGLTVSDVAAWGATPRGAGPLFDHVVNEWQTHIQGRSGGSGDSGSVVFDADNMPGDGFTVTAEPALLRLLGDSPRGLVNAVSWVLECLGFGWVEPGDKGVAFRQRGTLPLGEHRRLPRFPRRTLILGQDALHDDWREWTVWASRNRLNDIFFHDTPPSRLGRNGARPASARELAADGGGWLFERWRADGAAIVAAARERGMTVQFGGHHLPVLVPRDRFDGHPEWFPFRNGQRDPRYNLCVSSAGALACLRDGAQAFVGQFPGADTYHLWADDIRGGGWCSCSGCRAMTPSDQALTATNAVAEALAGSGAEVSHLAYRDTATPPPQVRPAEGVSLLWAPRERCYAHGIADAACEKNRDDYWKPFLGLVDVFANHSRRIDVFEYYSDAILFKGMAPPHLDVVPADAASYAAAGVANLQNLMVGDRPWVGPPWPAWWMARCAWDPAASRERALSEFCELAFGGAGPEFAALAERSEAAYQSFLDLHDQRMALRHDVLDFSDEPRATLRLKVRELDTAAATLEGAAFESLRLSSTSWDAGGPALREAIQATFAASVASHLASRTAAWDAALDGDRKRARSTLDHASQRLAAIEAWDAEWNTPSYAVITSSMRRAMHYHLDQIEALLR